MAASTTPGSCGKMPESVRPVTLPLHCSECHAELDVTYRPHVGQRAENAFYCPYGMRMNRLSLSGVLLYVTKRGEKPESP
jgi:hypothetical protein